MPKKRQQELEDLEPYLAILPDGLVGSDFMSQAYASVYSIKPETFARLLRNIHMGRPPWLGVAAHSSANRFEHVANLLSETGLVWFDQHKMQWELTDTAVARLEGV